MSEPAKPFVILPDANADLEKDRILLKAVQDLDVEQVQRGGRMQGLLLAMLFFGLGGLNWGWEPVVSVGVAVILHEMGHVLAMRHLGYKNVRMLLVPLFGGLATGEAQTSDAGKNAIVALAGPLFGLVTTALAGVVGWYAGSPSWLVNFVYIALVLNAFNLLPFYPLDGGQVARELLFSRKPGLELVFRMLGSLALAALAWFDHSLLLGLLAFATFATIVPAIQEARFLKEYREEKTGCAAMLDEQMVARFRTAIKNIYSSVHADKLEKNMPRLVKRLWLELHKTYPGPGMSLLLMAAYIGTSIIFMPVLGFAAIYWLGRPEIWTPPAP